MHRVTVVLTSLVVIGAIGLVVVWLGSREGPGTGTLATAQGTPSAAIPTQSNVAALPNPGLTPGVASADVTPADITSTICVVGYTRGRRLDDGRTVRPPEAYTSSLKVQQIVQYGYTDKNPADYEEDHLIPLELGGDGYAVGNLWPEPYAGNGARVKDQLENRMHQLVCSGQLGLRAAQQAIAGNWYAAYQRYVLAA